MVFEYVLGENLEKTIERTGAIPQLSALRMLIQLTRCVSYLHDHELIHRDLKPANVIVQGDGTVKLVDFGLARSLNELYVRGTRVRGTPAYMAPEQVMGIHLTVSTDLYQLGITMYEMLAGELPYPTGDMAYAHVHKVPPLLSEKYPVDQELCALVASCLKKQPKDRPASARDLLDQLSQIYARLSADEDLGLAQLSEPSHAFIEATRTSGSFPSIRVDDHFTDIESGEFEIPEVNERKGVPVYVPWLVGAAVAAVIIFIGVNLINGSKDQSASASEVVVGTIAEPSPAAEPAKVVVEPPTEVAVEVPPEIPAELPEEHPADTQAKPQPVAVQRPIQRAANPVVQKPVVVPEAEVEKPVEKPIEKPAAKPVQKVAKKTDDVMLIPPEPKSGGLLNVGGDTKKSEGGFLPTN